MSKSVFYKTTGTIFIFLTFNTLCFSGEWKILKNLFEISKQSSHLNTDTLLFKGEYLQQKGFLDSSLHYFNHILARYNSNMNTHEQLNCARASNNIGSIYLNKYNYFSALKKFIWALDVVKNLKNEEYERKIENNLGVAYFYMNEYEKSYSIFKRFFEYNLSLIERDTNLLYKSFSNMLSSAMYTNDKNRLNYVLQIGNIKNLLIDPLTCFPYYLGLSMCERLWGNIDDALASAKKTLLHIPELPIKNNFLSEAHHHIALCYFAKKEFKSALIHIDSSNQYVSQNQLMDVLSNNYSLQIDIFNIQGDSKKRIQALENQTRIKDSMLKFQKNEQFEFYSIVSKNENKITLLQNEQNIKSQTIKMQSFAILMFLFVVVILFIFLVIVWKQKSKLNHGYRILYEKQQELLRTMEKPWRTQISKKENACQQGEEQAQRKKQLTSSIMDIMENSDLIYQADFNLDMLAKASNSNTHYISETINECFGKNFTTLINEIRINKVCLYMNMPEYQKYTLDFIAQKVGFKNRATFNSAFKKHTGITPTQYLKLSREDKA